MQRALTALALSILLGCLPSLGTAGLFGTDEAPFEGPDLRATGVPPFVDYDGVPTFDGSLVLSETTKKRFKIIDNTGTGAGGVDELMEYFEGKGWETDYDEDSFQAGFLQELRDVDVLYIIAHSGVSASTGEVGFAWRNYRFPKKVTVLANEVAKALEYMERPPLVVVAGCQTSHNPSMAKAFGGAFVGFQEPVFPLAGYPFCSTMLRAVADGKSIDEAYRAALSIELGGSMGAIIQGVSRRNAGIQNVGNGDLGSLEKQFPGKPKMFLPPYEEAE